MLSIQQPKLVSLVNELVEQGLVQANRLHAENERRLAEAVAPLSSDQFRAAPTRVIVELQG